MGNEFGAALVPPELPVCRVRRVEIRSIRPLQRTDRAPLTSKSMASQSTRVNHFLGIRSKVLASGM